MRFLEAAFAALMTRVQPNYSQKIACTAQRTHKHWQYRGPSFRDHHPMVASIDVKVEQDPTLTVCTCRVAGAAGGRKSSSTPNPIESLNRLTTSKPITC